MQGRIGLHGTGQIVIMQLVAPVRMRIVLSAQACGQFGTNRHLAGILAHGPAQDTHRILLLISGFVVPTFNRGGGVPHIPSGDRMRPGRFGQRADGAF